MSVRVNLLPREIEVRRRERRITGITAVVVVLFLLLLGGLYMLKLGEVREAEQERDDVQAEVAQLQAEVARLEQFRQLANQLEARNALLATAMEREISFSRVLNDLSLAFPATASLRTLGAEVRLGQEVPADGAPQVAFGEPVASVTFGGYSVERYAPGVETVLVEFDKVRAFFHPYIASAGEEAIGTTDVVQFAGSVQLNEDAFTRRYVNGLPEGEVR